MTEVNEASHYVSPRAQAALLEAGVTWEAMRNLEAKQDLGCIAASDAE